MADCRCTSHNGFLTDRGYAEVAQREQLSAEGLTRSENCVIVDKVGSVSALVEVEEFHVFDDDLIDSQYRRFLNGS